MASRHLSRSIVMQSLYEWDFYGKKSDLKAITERNIKDFGPGLESLNFIWDLIIYFQSIKNKVHNNKRISMTGFVPEENISNYYSVADLCMIPYREFISSSGPLSLALSYQRPVILSKELQTSRSSTQQKR